MPYSSSVAAANIGDIHREKKPKKTKRKFETHRFFELVRDYGFRKRVKGAIGRLLKRTFHSIRIKISSGDFTYGSGDPAATGLMAGKFYAFRYSTAWLDIGNRFSFTPDFTKKIVKGEVKGRVLVFPGRIVFAALLFIIEWLIFKTRSIFKKVKIKEK